MYASIGVAAGLSNPGPYNVDFEMRDDTAKEIVTPLARLIARSKFNQRWGYIAMQGGEYIDCIAATVEYGVQIAPGVTAKVSNSAPPTPSGRSNVYRRPTTPATEPNGEPVSSERAGSNGTTRTVIPSAELPDEPPFGGWQPFDHTHQQSD